MNRVREALQDATVHAILVAVTLALKSSVYRRRRRPGIPGLTYTCPPISLVDTILGSERRPDQYAFTGRLRCFSAPFASSTSSWPTTISSGNCSY